MAKDDNLGALWKKVRSNGDEFYTGVLENGDGTKTKIVVFKNGFKDKDSQPDFMILRAREQQSTFNFNENVQENDFEDDLPF